MFSLRCLDNLVVGVDAVCTEEPLGKGTLHSMTRASLIPSSGNVETIVKPSDWVLRRIFEQ